MKVDEKELIPYLRVGTTIFKRVLMPLSNGRSLENIDSVERGNLAAGLWQGLHSTSAEVRRILYHSEPYRLPPGDSRLSEPLRTDFDRACQGVSFPHIRGFFSVIFFGEQIEMGLDYLQLLYLRPLQRLRSYCWCPASGIQARPPFSIF